MQERFDTLAAALWCSAYIGNLPTVDHLLAEGVDVNLWDVHGRTALTFAADAGHVDVVRRLLSAGAWIDPFEAESVYMSPLMCAADRGHLEVVELLLDAGADPTRTGGLRICTAEYYARASHPYIAAILRRAEDKWRAGLRS